MVPYIEFELVGVPDNWSNTGVWSRRAAIAQHEKMKLWTRNVMVWGMTKRLTVGWEKAEEGHPQRCVSVYQYRHGELDDDGLFTSVKPLVDGCQTYLRRGGKRVFGAGLIWRDNPKHCRIITDQTRVSFSIPCRTVIRVERFDI